MNIRSCRGYHIFHSHSHSRSQIYHSYINKTGLPCDSAQKTSAASPLALRPSGTGPLPAKSKRREKERKIKGKKGWRQFKLPLLYLIKKIGDQGRSKGVPFRNALKQPRAQLLPPSRCCCCCCCCSITCNLALPLGLVGMLYWTWLTISLALPRDSTICRHSFRLRTV